MSVKSKPVTPAPAVPQSIPTGAVLVAPVVDGPEKDNRFGNSLVAAAERGGWTVTFLPGLPAGVKQHNPRRGKVSFAVEFTRKGSTVIATTLIGRKGTHHPDTFLLTQGGKTRKVEMGYEQLGTLESAPDADGNAVIPTKDPNRKRIAA